MRKFIIGLVIGVAISAVAIAGAKTVNSYWSRGGNSYTCQGIASGVSCKERSAYGLYGIAITPTYVVISRGKTAVMGCTRGYDTADVACIGP